MYNVERAHSASDTWEEKSRLAFVTGLAWLPLAVLGALELALYLFPKEAILGGYEAVPVLNLVFLTATTLLVSLFAAITYVGGGLVIALPLGAGMLIQSACTLLASILLTRGQRDPAVAIATLGYTETGFFLVVAVVMLAKPENSSTTAGRWVSLIGGYCLALLLLSGTVWAVRSHKLPPFYIQGVGSTPARNIVLVATICEFGICSGLLLWGNRLRKLPFVRWFGLGLGLMAIGWAGMFSYQQLDSLDAWIARVSVYLGGLYPLVASLIGVRRSGALRLPLEALREAYQRYTSLVDTSPDAIVVIADGRYLFANPAAVELFGVTAPQDLIGRPVLDYLPPEDRPMAEERLARLVHLEGRGPMSEAKILRPDGRTVEVEAIRAVVSFRGRTALQIVIRDVSKRKKAERALQELNDTLERRIAERTAVAERRAQMLRALSLRLAETEDRERRRFADFLHDDLQQLLVSARMRLQALAADIRDKGAAEQLVGILDEAVQRSKGLSIELSPPVLRQSGLPASLGWLVQQMRLLHGIEVTVETAGWSAECDAPTRVLLFRCVQELLFNVVKHAGNPDARIRLSRTDNTVSVDVQDRGKGFDPHVLSSAAAGAAGLGLLNIRERVEAIGGSMKVESAPGQGCRVSLLVPCSPAAAVSEEAPAAAAGFPGETGRREKAAGTATGLRVLFVDDHQVMRQGLISMVETEADIVVVGEASNGRQAVECARTLVPDVIVMDVSMPVMNGMEATRAIKAEMPGMRVIALSMFDDETTAGAMREAGAEAFVSKTAPRETLLKALRGKP